MIIDTMSPTEIKKEIIQDNNWLLSRSNGWKKKYHKRLQLKYKDDFTILEHKKYKSPLHNNIHCFFVCKQWNNQKWNGLLLVFIWEVLTYSGRKRYFILNTTGEYTLVTSHSVERMQERSGKTFIEMFEENIKSSTHGIMAWVNYKGGASNELMAKFGDGFLFGYNDEFDNTIVKTYVSNSMQFQNQECLVNESIWHSEAFCEDANNVFLTRKYRRGNCVKVSA